jgi:hypothetical protein
MSADEANANPAVDDSPGGTPEPSAMRRPPAKSTEGRKYGKTPEPANGESEHGSSPAPDFDLVPRDEPSDGPTEAVQRYPARVGAYADELIGKAAQRE